jgi:hypothetical protein
VVKGRRGRGEGSIHRRASDGLWIGTITVGWSEGRQEREDAILTGREADAPKRAQLGGRSGRPQLLESLAVIAAWPATATLGAT